VKLVELLLLEGVSLFVYVGQGLGLLGVVSLLELVLEVEMVQLFRALSKLKSTTLLIHHGFNHAPLGQTIPTS